MWWPFAKRGTRVDEMPQVKLPVELPAELAAFAANTACIKLWLPETLIQALDSMSASHGMSRPDVLRWLLFEHVYGRPALDRLKEWKRQKDAEDALRFSRKDGADVRFSLKRSSERSITAQLLGKSIEDFKLWLPIPLKNELAILAATEKLRLSDYLRKTLVRLLLGESFHHRWQAAIGRMPSEAEEFEASP